MLFFWSATCILRETRGMFRDQQKVNSVEVQTVFSNGFGLILDFNLQIFIAQHLFSKSDNFQKLPGL